jgi:hypothetical protein
MENQNYNKKHDKKQDRPACCASKGKAEGRTKKGYTEGILYGLVPHAGCIAFILFTVIGATTAAAFFRPLLMKSYFFYGLIALSLVFATISAGIYLKKNSALSSEGVRSNWKYLSIMYGTTIAVNLVFFMLIFPMLANITSASQIGAVQEPAGPSKITLKVAIPCPGHASLITGELYKVNGVKSVNFRFPNLFDVVYLPSDTSEKDILSIDIFKEYKAEKI